MVVDKVRLPRLPAPQHMARNWHPEPKRIADSFVRMMDNPPRISYQRIYSVLYQRMLFGDDLAVLDQCIDGIDARSWFRADLKLILRLVDSRLSMLGKYRPLEVAEDRYGIGQGQSIPFKPRLVLADDRADRLPWLLLWKEPALDELQLRLLNTIIRDRMEERPDLESASLEFWDLSKPNRHRNSRREMSVIKSADITALSASELSEMLEIFVVGFELACKEIKRRAADTSSAKPAQIDRHVGQQSLFD